MASSRGFLLTFFRLTLVEPYRDDKQNNADGDCTGDLARSYEIVLNGIPVITGSECEKRNESEPDRRRAGDRQQDFQRRQLHRARQRRNDCAHPGQESTDEQPAKAVALVQLLDPLLGGRSGVLLEAVQESLRSVP